MASLSDVIENYINDIMAHADKDSIDIQRNILAQQFKCAPSQINYVLTTRFNNDRGYVVESRRGGGGYVRIYKMNVDGNRHIKTIIKDTIGDSLTRTRAESIISSLMDNNIINEREKHIMTRALSDRSLQKIFHGDRNTIRADLLKEMLLILV
jgi:transcriptional regulator CtsR